MVPDWKSLEPHRPLSPGDPKYVDRPGESGATIRDLVQAGKNTILLAGTVGVGKSTELANAAKLLQSERVACLVQLDRTEDMRRISGERALLLVAARIAFLAISELHLDVSAPVREVLVQRGVLPPEMLRGSGGGRIEGSSLSIATAAAREVSRLAKQGRVAILVDGTEKTTEESAADVFSALGQLPEELDVVVVAPWHAAYGPRGFGEVIRSGERLLSIRPVEVEGTNGEAGRRFMVRLLERRFGVPKGFLDTDENVLLANLPPNKGIAVPPPQVAAVVKSAAEWSGGVPRVFLQLIADTATYGRLRQHGSWLSPEDLPDAVSDMRDSFRRVLLPGDTEALRAVEGTDGREIAIDRKLRLLAHSVLVERVRSGVVIMEPHPIARSLLPDGAQRA